MGFFDGKPQQQQPAIVSKRHLEVTESQRDQLVAAANEHLSINGIDGLRMWESNGMKRLYINFKALHNYKMRSASAFLDLNASGTQTLDFGNGEAACVALRAWLNGEQQEKPVDLTDYSSFVNNAFGGELPPADAFNE